MVDITPRDVGWPGCATRARRSLTPRAATLARWGFALWLLFSLTSACSRAPEGSATTADPTTARPPAPDRLALHHSIEVAIERDAEYAYPLPDLEPGVYRLLLDARGNELRVQVRDGEGQIVRETVGSGETWGLESITFPVSGSVANLLPEADAVDLAATEPPAAQPTVSLWVMSVAGSPSISLELTPRRLEAEAVEAAVEAEALLAKARRGRDKTVEASRAAQQDAAASADLFREISDPLGETIAALETASICIEDYTSEANCIWEEGQRALGLSEQLDRQRLVEQALPPAALGEFIKHNPAAAHALLDRLVDLERGTTTPRHQARGQIFRSALHASQVASAPNATVREEAIRLRRETAEHARALFRQAGDRLGEAESNATLGGYARKEGKIALSLGLYQEAEATMVPRGKYPRAEANLFNNLGVLYRSQSDVQRALEVYGRARKIYEATGFGPGTQIYSNLGRLHRILGDFETAIEMHNKVLNDRPDVAAVDLGHVYFDQGQTEEALDSFRLSKTRNTGHREYLGWALVGEGQCLLELGRYEEAKSSLERALEIYRQARLPQSQAIALRGLGLVAWRAGELESAKDRLAQASRLMTELGDSFHAARYDARIGAIEHQQGNLDVALDYFERATETYESLRSDLGSIEQRTVFYASQQDHYVDFIGLLADLDSAHPGEGYAERAYAVSEQARARSLVDMLRRSRWESAAEPESELMPRLREINARLEWIRDEIEAVVGGPPSGRERLEGLRAELDAEQTAYNETWEEIREQFPRYAELRSPSPISLERLQSTLTPSMALLQYALGERNSYLFVVTQERVSLVILEEPRNVITTASHNLYRSMTQRRANETAFEADARDLYEKLLLPAEAALAGRTEWIIAPDGPLYTTPFEALLLPTDSGERRFLIERASLHYIPSATALVTLETPSRATRAPTGLAAFYDSVPLSRPLPGAREEVEAIRRIMGSAASTGASFFGPDATEANVRSSPAVQRARWLHFSTHGDFDASDPASTGIVLAPEGEDDGLLTSREVLELELSADLVVLSGCRTGLGKNIKGEGIVGLTRAFMFAGAQSVVVSLWQVEDRSAAKLMVGFYESLRSERTRAEAIRAAKLELIGSERWSHPYYWAPFVLIGPS